MASPTSPHHIVDVPDSAEDQHSNARQKYLYDMADESIHHINNDERDGGMWQRSASTSIVNLYYCSLGPASRNGGCPGVQ